MPKSISIEGALGWARHSLAPSLSAVACGLLAWWAVTASGMVNPLFLPPLDAMASATVRVLTAPQIFWDGLQTGYRVFWGLLLSALVGIPLGLIFGRMERLYRYFELPVDFFRSVPSSSLFPIFILIFGIGDASKAAVVFYGCAPIMLINTLYGARPTKEKQDRINMLRSFGASPAQIFLYAVARDASPHIAAGFRISVSMAFVLVIVTEMFLGANSGLGRQIYDYYLQYRIPEMYAAILMLGGLGYFSNRVFLVLEKKVAFWQR